MAACRMLKPLKISLLTLFAGWILAWLTIPTKVFLTEWLPAMDTKFNSPPYYHAREYYGKQGFFFTFLAIPIVLIAAVGCVYLHYQRKEEEDITRRGRENKSIVSVIPLLGIVTSVEFFFLLMFVILLLWSIVNYLYSHLSSEITLEKPHLDLWHAKFRNVAVRLGTLGNICWAFIFFPVTRGSSVLQFFGLTSESSIKYHIWLGHTSTALFLAHGVVFLVYWTAMLDDVHKLKTWRFAGPSTIGAEILVVIVIVVWVTSQRTFRRKKFEVFYYTHQLYPLYILFYVLHAGAPALSMIIPGIFLFAIDRYLRFLQSRRSVRVISCRKLPNDFCEITFAKSSKLVYQPGSILFLNVPSISKMQWHPFSVTSNNNMEPEKLSVVVASSGSWTTRLNHQVDCDYLQASVEGPYSPNFCKFLSHEKLVFVTGGSGITPCISYCREIVFRSAQGCPVPKVLLICSFKATVDLSLLNLLISGGTPLTATQNIDLQIEAYITREPVAPESPRAITEDGVKTIMYKTSCFDYPVTSVLGPNNWLWLGAIIVSSFGMFLLLLAIAFRFHISRTHYHHSLYVMWDLFLMCACVFFVSSVMFLILKNRNRLRTIHCLHESHPPEVPEVENSDVESFSHESFVQTTTIYYGRRPDIKKILLELEEDDVGVVACGPSQMTHDVARVCALEEATNLHFEAISFSW